LIDPPNPPPHAEFLINGPLLTKQRVEFDASGSHDPNGDQLRYLWEFGDHTPRKSGAKTSHMYAKPGTYIVRLQVSDGTSSDVAVHELSIRSPSSPQACFHPEPPPRKKHPYILDGSCSSDKDGQIVRYAWTFEDGSSAEGISVSKTFSEPGPTKVLLTVVDNDGLADSLSQQLTIAQAGNHVWPIVTAGTLAMLGILAFIIRKISKAGGGGDDISIDHSTGLGTHRLNGDDNLLGDFFDIEIRIDDGSYSVDPPASLIKGQQ